MVTIRTYWTSGLRRVLSYSSVGLMVMLSLALGMLATVPEAHAASICRGDPIVMLSNGAKVQLSVTINQPDASQVSSVQYTLHAPTGTSITSIVYTGGSLQGKESVRFFADQSATHYAADILVTSSISSSMPTFLSVNGHSSLVTTSGSTNQSSHSTIVA